MSYLTVAGVCCGATGLWQRCGREVRRPWVTSGWIISLRVSSLYVLSWSYLPAQLCSACCSRCTTCLLHHHCFFFFSPSPFSFLKEKEMQQGSCRGKQCGCGCQPVPVRKWLKSLPQTWLRDDEVICLFVCFIWRLTTYSLALMIYYKYQKDSTTRPRYHSLIPTSYFSSMQSLANWDK